MHLNILSLCAFVIACIGISAASAPYFTLPSYRIFDEDMTNGTVLFDFNVTDDDTVKLTHFPSDLLTLSPTTGTSTFGVNVILKSMFDRETSSRHTLRIVATDDDKNEVVKSMEIYVNDVNDNRPSFDNTPYFWDIPELPYNMSLTYDNIHATDPDSGNNGTVRYSFEPKTQADATADEYRRTFNINSTTGQISLLKPLDYANNSYYQFTVFAKDLGTPPLTSEVSLVIRVQDVQNRPPFFTGIPYRKSIYEEGSANSPVITVNARDGDTGISNPVNYSIEEGPCPGYFNINKDNGEIRTSKNLDRDSGTLNKEGGVCILKVLVTEIDGNEHQYGNTTATADVTITVNDLNDNSPIFEKQNYTAKLTENAQHNVPIQLDDPRRIIVTDLDQGNNAVMNITLEWQNGSICNDFKVSPDVVHQTGSLIIQVEKTDILDYEKIQTIELLIVAVEIYNASHHDTASLTLTLTDENDNTPQFTESRYVFNISEEPPLGTFVGQISATDVDSGSYGNVTYTLLGSEDKFEIHNQNGSITTICKPRELDRETIGVYYLTVTATDEGGQGRSNSTSVRINLQDVNDKTPAFTRDTYQVFVKENEEYLTKPVLVVQAQDGDEMNTSNSQIEYFLDSDSDSWILSNITVNSTGEIYFQYPIDFEKLPNQTSGVFTFNVSATDFGEPARVGNATVEVTVEDLNDNSPMFNKSQYYSEVQENATSSVNSLYSVISVSATDLDGSERNSRVQYFIQDGAFNRFAINSHSGELFVQRNAELDREIKSVYNITVLAIDLGSNPLNGTTRVIINVTDVNDQSPEFNSSTCGTDELPEDRDKGTIVTVCKATDLDTDHELSYTITAIKATDENGHLVNRSLVENFFTINSPNGAITVKSALDRETAETIELTLQVQDLHAELNTPQIDSKILILTILDVNDNDPEFDSENYTMSVSENALDNTRLGEVHASDIDKNRTISYTINSGDYPTSSFRIGRKTGIIFKNGTVDRENSSTVQLQVTATDDGVPTRNTTTTVHITVIDFNDNTPVFFANSTNQIKDISESIENGTEVLTLEAYDLDDGPNAKITFSIESGGEGHFVIDTRSGCVSTSSMLDREEKPVYTIVINAKDNPIDETQQRINRTTLTVRLMDENDNAPNFTQANYSVTVVEIEAVGTPIQTVTAVDKDAGQNSEVTYSLLNDTDPPGLFAINIISGEIYVNSSLLTHVGSFVLQLMAKDKGSPSLNGTALANITVTDFNINPPVIGNLPTNGTINVLECKEIGEEIYKFTYTDRDRGENAKAYFNITSIDNDGVLDMFYINGTGSLIVKSKLDANQAESYKFQIQATDKGLPPLSSDIHSLSIQVIDVNNFLPTFQNTTKKLSVAENSQNGTLVGTVTATDKDKHSRTCYNISNSLNFTLFDIEETSGEVTTKRMLDRETDGDELMIIVMAWDCTTSSNTCDNVTIDPGQDYRPTITVHIQVLDVDDNPPVFVNDEISVGMRRNEEVGFVLDLNLKRGGYVKDNDTDRYGNQSWVFENNGTATFSPGLHLQPGTGTNDCAVKGVKNLFCITGNGTVVNNKFFSEDMSGFILLPVTVRDNAGADQTVLKVYLISDSQVLIMTIFDTKQSVAGYKDVLLEIYSNVTKYNFVYDGLQDHKTTSGNIDTSRSDLYFHVVEPKTQRVLPSDEAQRLVDSFYDLLRDARNNYKILQVLASTAAQETEEDDPMRTVYILTAVVVLLALTVAIIVYVSFTLRSRYKRKIKALTVDKAVIAKEDSVTIIPGSNQYSKMSNPLLNANLDQIPHYDNISLSSNNSIDMNDVDNARDDTSYDKMEVKEKVMDMYTENPAYEEFESPLEAALRMHELNRASMETDYAKEAEDDDDDPADIEKVAIHGFINETFEMETSDI